MLDLSCFDEINPETNQNKMSESIKLFIETISELNPSNGHSVILILNNGRNIGVCKEFQFIQSNDFETVIAGIANTLKETAKRLQLSTNIFTHIVSDMSGAEMQRMSTDFVHCVISYTLAKGGIVH